MAATRTTHKSRIACRSAVTNNFSFRSNAWIAINGPAGIADDFIVASVAIVTKTTIVCDEKRVR